MKSGLAALLPLSLYSTATSISADSFLGACGTIIHSSPNTRSDELAGAPLFDSRWAAWRDTASQAQLEATIGQGHAQIQMNSSLLSFVPPLPSVFFRYTSQKAVSLLGSSALEIDVGEVVGSGYLYVEIDTQQTSDGQRNRVAITG